MKPVSIKFTIEEGQTVTDQSGVEHVCVVDIGVE